MGTLRPCYPRLESSSRGHGDPVLLGMARLLPLARFQLWMVSHSIIFCHTVAFLALWFWCLAFKFGFSAWFSRLMFPVHAYLGFSWSSLSFILLFLSSALFQSLSFLFQYLPYSQGLIRPAILFGALLPWFSLWVSSFLLSSFEHPFGMLRPLLFLNQAIVV